MKLSISEAARIAGISRQHFYTKYINPGVISIDRDNPDKPTIDTSELLRVFGDIQLPDRVVSAGGQELTQELSRKIVALDAELTAVRQQLSASQEREKWLQGTVDRLADTIRLLEHKPTADNQAEELQAELTRTREALEAERRKGFFARLFRR